MRVATQHGCAILKVALHEGQQRGMLFACIHWSGETASSARVGDLVAAGRLQSHERLHEAQDAVSTEGVNLIFQFMDTVLLHATPFMS